MTWGHARLDFALADTEVDAVKLAAQDAVAVVADVDHRPPNDMLSEVLQALKSAQE